MSKLGVTFCLAFLTFVTLGSNQAPSGGKFNYDGEDCVRSIKATANDIYYKYLETARTKKNKLRELREIMKKATKQLYGLNDKARNNPATILDLDDLLITPDRRVILCTLEIASKVIRINNKTLEAYATA